MIYKEMDKIEENIFVISKPLQKIFYDEEKLLRFLKNYIRNRKKFENELSKTLDEAYKTIFSDNIYRKALKIMYSILSSYFPGSSLNKPRIVLILYMIKLKDMLNNEEITFSNYNKMMLLAKRSYLIIILKHFIEVLESLSNIKKYKCRILIEEDSRRKAIIFYKNGFLLKKEYEDLYEFVLKRVRISNIYKLVKEFLISESLYSNYINISENIVINKEILVDSKIHINISEKIKNKIKIVFRSLLFGLTAFPLLKKSVCEDMKNSQVKKLDIWKISKVLGINLKIKGVKSEDYILIKNAISLVFHSLIFLSKCVEVKTTKESITYSKLPFFSFFGKILFV